VSDAGREAQLQEKETQMNSDIFQGKWNQFKGDIKRQWGLLTDNDVALIEGNYDKFVGLLQERYGWERAHAEREINNYFESHPVR
jgi:uncharacterized protein YjbJ (UPF0337 family)